MDDELPFQLFTTCKLTVSDKISFNDGIYKVLTEVLHFKILGFNPLVIEKDCPSQQDICKVFDVVKEFKNTKDFVHVFIDDSKGSLDLGATGNKIKNKDLMQTLEKTPEIDQEITKHIREKQDIDTCNLTDFFEKLQVNDETKDEDCTNKAISQYNFHGEQDLSSSDRPEHVKQLGASSDELLKQEIDKDYKSAVSQGIHVSVESPQVELESGNNPAEEEKYELTIRQIQAKDYLYRNRILLQHKLVNDKRKEMTQKLEKEQECDNSVLQLQSLSWKNVNKKNAETANLETEYRTPGSDREINCSSSDTDNVKQFSVDNKKENLKTSDEENCEKETQAGIYDQKLISRNQMSIPDVTSDIRVSQIGKTSEQCCPLEVESITNQTKEKVMHNNCRSNMVEEFTRQSTERRLNADEQFTTFPTDTYELTQNKEKDKEHIEMAEASTQQVDFINTNIFAEKDKNYCEQVVGHRQPQNDQLEKKSKNTQTEEREHEIACKQKQCMNNMNEGLTRSQTADMSHLKTMAAEIQTQDREEDMDGIEIGEAHSQINLPEFTKQVHKVNQEFKNEDQNEDLYETRPGQTKQSSKNNKCVTSLVETNTEDSNLYTSKQREDLYKQDDNTGDESYRQNREKRGSSSFLDKKCIRPQITSTEGQQSESENSQILTKKQEQVTKETWSHEVNSQDQRPYFHDGEKNVINKHRDKKSRDQMIKLKEPQNSFDRMLQSSKKNPLFETEHGKSQPEENIREDMKNEMHKPEHYDYEETEGERQLCGSSITKQVLESNQRSKQDDKKNATHKKNIPKKSLHHHGEIKDEDIVSSGSDEESQVIYPMNKTSFHVAKEYFMESDFRSYFDTAVDESTRFIFKLNACSGKDVKFLHKLKKMKFEEFEFVDKDVAYVKSFVRNIEPELTGLTLQVKSNKVHLIGSNDIVAAGRKKLASLLQYDDRRNMLSPRSLDRKDEDTEMRLLKQAKPDVKRNSDRREISGNETFHETSESQNLSVRPKIRQSAMSNPEQSYNSYSLYDKPYDYTTSGFINNNFGASGNDGRYFTTELSQLKVRVYKASIIELKVDCIVNAANRRLQHGGGVAKVISSAAGPALNKECEVFINSGNILKVTDIFVSKGGDLHAKYVIHAVGPKWDSYEDGEKITCLHDLRHTVLRCLVEASRRGMTSVALPSISAALFKVPKDLCATCYLEAVKHFDIFNIDCPGTLKEIHFVDIDDTMINIIREMFMNNWSRPCHEETVQNDCKFAKDRYIVSRQETTKDERSSISRDKTFDQSKPQSPSTFTRTPAGASTLGTARQSENKATYFIGKIKLHIDSKPAFDLTSDITITLGKPFDKLSGLRDYSIKSHLKRQDKMLYSKNTFEFLNVSKPGGKQSRLLCAVYPEPDKDDKMNEAFRNLEKAIENSGMHVTALVLTSSILYPEPSNKQQKKGNTNFDRKNVGKFARCLYDHLKRICEDVHITISVVGSEITVTSIMNVLESRDVKKIAPGAYHGSSQRTGSMAQSKGHNYEHNQHSQEKSTYSSVDIQKPGCAGGGGIMNESQVERPGNHQPNSSQEYLSYSKGKQNPQHFEDEDVGTPVDSDSICQICYGNRPSQPVRCCKKMLCQDCMKKVTLCPFCRKVWRTAFGNQPPGTMTVRRINDHADGYENVAAWKIEYYFPPGTQQACHPSPGKIYYHAKRTAYLPDNETGFQVLMLLRLAFIRKITFTIGHSLTKDMEDSIIWNDIHHKTSLHGGSHGYPDPTYLHKVIIELENKGVTLDTITESEKPQMNYFHYSITSSAYFYDVIPH